MEVIHNMVTKNAYPQPDAARAEWLNLNGRWAFSVISQGEEAAKETAGI